MQSLDLLTPIEIDQKDMARGGKRATIFSQSSMHQNLCLFTIRICQVRQTLSDECDLVEHAVTNNMTRIDQTERS
jgi:hypothetical protein